MSPLQGAFESADHLWARDEKQDEVAINERVKELGGEDLSEKLKFWRDRIEASISGKYEGNFVFTKKDEGVHHMGNANGTFFVIEKNSPLPLLSKNLRDSLKEFDFEEIEGSKNFVYSKTFRNTGIYRQMHS